MNDISLRLMWLIAQVTLVSACASSLTAILSRGFGRVTTGVLQAALLLVFLLTACSLSSWPSWTTANPTEVVVVEPANLDSAVSLKFPSSKQADGTLTPNEPVATQAAWGAKFYLASSAALEGVSLIVIPLFGVFLLLGSLRFCLGWWAIGKLLRTSTLATDVRCTNMLCSMGVQAAAGSVAIRQHEALVAPATMGWRQPVILLPSNWRTWKPEELRAVLAHELAYIEHRDFATLCMAQFIAVFHFYHPLVHRLVSKLRHQQELAADAAAAELAGGRDQYVSSLVSLALQSDSQKVVWPLRCFLPTSDTFLRRIEMLKNPLEVGMQMIP